MPDKSEYSRIDNVTEEECFDRWQGVRWQGDEGDKGTCYSDYDFDGWSKEKEEGDENED